MRRGWLYAIACTLACASDDRSGGGSSEATDASEAADTSRHGESGDGDGEPGDGDGDGESGDGDGDGESRDGEGDGESRDGEGDGDGDGDPGDGDGEPNDSDCTPSAFEHAPAPVEIDGLSAVPIDILELDAELSFDAALATAHAHATLTFQLGETGGMPILDLRQTPELTTLDGQPLAQNALARHNFGIGLTSGFRILAAALEPCSVHELELDYTLGIPQSPLAAGLSFEPGRVHFDIFATDLNPGRYLEAWLPANMPWDRHPISLGVTLDGAEVAHALISNAFVDEVAPHAWQLELPSTTTAMDPMIVLMPIDELDSHVGVHMAANGQAIPYAIHVDTQVATSAAIVATNVAGYVDELVLKLGDYAHPELTVYVYPTRRSMEYAGATTSALGALRHELFHSWWGRGLSPATYADGWIDEAWDVFLTGGQLVAVPFDWQAGPWQLRNPHPFARTTPTTAYQQGRLFFAGLADLMGVEPLQAAMAELYASAPLSSLSTAQLERHLYCASGELPEARQAFHRFVHGLEGDAAPVPDGWCD